MTTDQRPVAHRAPAPASRARSVLALVAFLAIAFAIAALGGIATSANVQGWYADAEKVPWNPPGAVFGPVWTFLYAAMSVAAWFVWRRPPSPQRTSALSWYVAQLFLNSIWTPVFFGLYPVIGASALWIALGIILLLDVAVVGTIVAFWRVHRGAAVLLVPYALWGFFATSLTLGIALLNS